VPVNWEAIAAVASLLSSLAVVGAIIVAVRQVRVGALQVEHLRRATQLEGTMKIFDKLGTAEQFEARRFVAQGLAVALKDPEYRAELELLSYAKRPHPELEVLRLMEMIGIYIKHGLIDEKIVFDYWSPAIVLSWPVLIDLGVVAAHREAGGPAIWENFEYMYDRAVAWESARGTPSPTTAPAYAYDGADTGSPANVG